MSDPTPDPAALLAHGTDVTEPLIALTRQQKRAGIAEAVLRASFDMPDLGDDEIVITGKWQKDVGGAISLYFAVTDKVTGGVVVEKTYDDLAVLGQIRLRR